MDGDGNAIKITPPTVYIAYVKGKLKSEATESHNTIWYDTMEIRSSNGSIAAVAFQISTEIIQLRFSSKFLVVVSHSRHNLR